MGKVDESREPKQVWNPFMDCGLGKSNGMRVLRNWLDRRVHLEGQTRTSSRNQLSYVCYSFLRAVTGIYLIKASDLSNRIGAQSFLGISAYSTRDLAFRDKEGKQTGLRQSSHRPSLAANQERPHAISTRTCKWPCANTSSELSEKLHLPAQRDLHSSSLSYDTRAHTAISFKCTCSSEEF